MPGTPGTLLAVGGSTAAATLVLTVAAAPAPGEFVSIFFLSDNHGHSSNLGITAVSDSRGGTWITSSFTAAQVGYAADSHVEIGSVVRSAGTDLQIGDTITITWDPTGVPPHTAVICHGLTGVTGGATKQTLGGPPCQIYYANSQSYPQGDGTSTDLLWGTSFVDEPIPCEGSTVSCITLAGGIGGASGWVPVGGTRFVETTQAGGLYLAVALQTTVLDAIPFQPGGSFTTPGTVVIANYQFVDPAVSGDPNGVFTTQHAFKAAQ